MHRVQNFLFDSFDASPFTFNLRHLNFGVERTAKRYKRARERKDTRSFLLGPFFSMRIQIGQKTLIAK